MKIHFFLSLILFLSFSSCEEKGEGQLKPVMLTCEYLENPAVVDVRQPRLGWINQASEDVRGQEQTAWQIRVASSGENLNNPDLWDSGKQDSDESTRIEYGGQPLTSRQECWWQVRVWDVNGQPSDWSEPAFWRMGLPEPSDWQAEWIGVPWQGEDPLPKPPGGPDALPVEYPPPAPLLRTTFEIGKPVSSAVAFVTGLGYFELYLNGEKVGNDELVPNQTNYGKRPDLIHQNIPLPDDFREYKVMYLAYDVKDQLKKGKNALGGILGNGFYNAPKYWAGSYGSPRFLCQLHLTYEDGTEEVIKSDPEWKVSKSAILMDLVYHGEHYDARLEQPGWNTPEFDDSSWEKAVPREAPFGKLVAHTARPDRVTQRIAPITIEKKDDNTWYVDFGIEISGRLRLNEVEGPAGHKIEIKYLSNQYSGDNSYIFRGEGPESYASRFNWFVFSAVEISNWPGELKPEHLTAEAVNTGIPETVVFETSNPLFNEINTIWQRSQLDNMHGGIASDCPHRERAAYTGDGQVACVTVMHNYDARNFYHKWIQDILGAQIVETGYVPNGAPWEPGCGGGVAWGAAICIMPWEFYLHYGSKDMLEDNYEGMKEYVRYMQTWVNEEGIMHSQRTGRDGNVLRWFNLGEWVAPGETVPDEMVHTFYFWRCADITAKVAEILNMKSEAEHFAGVAESSRQAFHNTFYNEEQGTYGKGGGNIFALRMGVPEDRYEKVIQSLRADIRANDGHLDTGIFGTQFFFETLSEHGMHDLAYAAMNKRTYPSYGRWIELGSTTTREKWDEGGSHNHPMFGGGLVWFYRKLAGMQADPDDPGYRHMIFRPQPVNDMEFAHYENLTPYGQAGIRWEQGAGDFRMKVKVPVGSHATVHVPADDPEKVMESGIKAADATGVRLIGTEDGYVVYEVVSGNYEFMVN